MLLNEQLNNLKGSYDLSGDNMKYDTFHQVDSEFNDSVRKKAVIRNYYGFIALGAGLFNGLNNFLYEIMVYTQISSSTLSLYFAECTGSLVFGIGYHIYEALQQKRKYGTFWAKERSTYIICNNEFQCSKAKGDHENGGNTTSFENNEGKQWKFNTYNIKAVFCRFAVSFTASFARIAVLWTESLADLNFSLVQNLAALGAFIVAVSFYFIFKEALNYHYIIGIVMLVSCAILTSVSSSSTSSDTDEYTLSAAVPIILALLQTFLAALVSIVTRYVVIHSEISVTQMVSDNFIMQGIVYMCLLIWSSFPYTVAVFWTIGAISMFGFAAILLLYLAVGYGKAGPSMALNNSSTIFTLLLEIIVLSKVPNVFQLIAFLIGLAGGALIAFESRTKKEIEYFEQLSIDEISKHEISRNR